MLTLIEPNEKYLKGYQEAYILSMEKVDCGEIKLRNQMFNDLSEFDVVQASKDHKDKSKLKPNRVVAFDYFAVEDEKFIGFISIRIELTPGLLRLGGHIGYGINPKYWRKGYGTEMLRLALIKAKELVKEDKVLITCDDDNIGSSKVIENNGGILENKIVNNDEFGEVLTRRYWIKIR